MSKAYDRVEFFIRKVMAKLEFNEEWIASMMNFLSSVSFFVWSMALPWSSVSQAKGFVKEILFPYIYLYCALKAFLSFYMGKFICLRFQIFVLIKLCPPSLSLFFFFLKKLLMIVYCFSRQIKTSE